MIKHFVLFTFEKDFFTKDKLIEFQKVFDEISNNIDGVISAQVKENCVDRPANMDLMIEMELTDESILPLYLNYPSHVKMGQKYNPHIIKRVSFDYKC